MPGAEQAFENRTLAQLCTQLNNPEQTGGRALEVQDLLATVSEMNAPTSSTTTSPGGS